MSWIKSVPYESAEGRLKTIYDRIKGPDDHIDNILKAHGLRPPTLEGHMALYKSVLHHPGNTLPKWLLETLGVYVSLLNGCDYCVVHHSEGLRRLLQDELRTDAIITALRRQEFPQTVFSEKEQLALAYARTLTLSPSKVGDSLIEDMREAGLADGEILEVNQVVSYFAYANRTVLGLGVTTEADKLGLSPSGTSSTDDWAHR